MYEINQTNTNGARFRIQCLEQKIKVNSRGNKNKLFWNDLDSDELK
jgi:hypothetical protein